MKIGVIGLGARIANLASDFKKAAPEAEFTAVADPSDARVAILEDLGSTPTRYDTAAEMLAGHKFDMLMIGSPNHMHLDHIKLALQSDVPFIFTEKPVVISVEESIALAHEIARHNGMQRLMVGLVLRYSPLYRALRQAQADGQIGEIMSIEASEHIAPYHGSFFMRDWRRHSAMSGSFMLEKCCHDIDLYQGVVGARPSQIASFGGRKKYLPEHRPADDVDYMTVAPSRNNGINSFVPRWGGSNDAFSGEGDLIDYQTALVEYENGANLCFHTNLNVPDQFRRFAVIGRDGMAEGDFIRNTFKVTLSDTSQTVVDDAGIGSGSETGHYGADAAMAQDVISYMRGQMPTLPLSVKDALEAGITAMAMDQAREERRIVDLRDVWAEFDAALEGRHAA
jgi:predicted dehydrogenase